MNGAGNDFVLIDNRDGGVSLSREQIARLCHRQRGVGADGLILLRNAKAEGDWAWDFYNADGSDAEMCGNGARCFASYIQHTIGGNGELSFETACGLVRATIGDTTDIPAVVTDAWVREATDRRLLDLERAANDVLRSPRRGFESVDGVVKLPADWADRQVAMGDLRTTLIEQFGLVDTDIPPVDVIGDLTQLNNVASNTSFRPSS